MAKTINTILNLKDRFTSKMKQVANHTKQQSKQMKLLNNHIDSFKQTAVSGFASVAKSAASIGIAFAGVNAAAEAFSNGVQFVKDYHSSLTNLQAATGATSQEMEEMKNQITDLYRQNLGESWSDLANAMSLAKQITGETGEELKKTTALAVTYRDTFGEDIGESIKAVDTMVKNFGISNEQAFNLLAQGAQQGLDKTHELLDTANEYSVYFSKLGFSANEMFNIFGAGMLEGSWSLDKIGDAVKEFNIRLKDDSKSTKEALTALGFDANKMMQTFANGGDGAKQAFREVINTLSNVKDEVQKNVIGVSLFGTMYEDLESDVISAFTSLESQFDMTKNTMQEINKIKYDSVSSAFKGIGRMIETSVLVLISDRLLPKLSQFGQWFQDNTPQIESALNKAFSVGSKVLDVFANSIAWARQNADWLIPVAGGLASAFAAQKVVGTISGLYEAWTKTTKGLTAAQIALNIAQRMSPLGWIATAIGLVIAGGIALWRNWDTVKAKATELWDWLKQVWANVKEGTINVFSGIGEKIKGSFSGIVGFLKQPLNATIRMVNTVIDGINSISFSIPDWLPESIGGGKSFALNIPKIPEFALGTSFFSGGLARINERGGEIVNLPNGSQVIPADKSEKLIEENSKRHIIININVQGNLIGEEEEINRLFSKAVPRIKLALSNV
ncbi:phage tail tape measure protein [Brevibacillus thermoruber]|uniref:phage tail tape measure protein n=1 Tax=Brevibacillus thermoruber TaxID=33942 RepID=UPI0040418CF1